MSCSGTAVPKYDQCGGDSWEGPTCCEEGFECVRRGGGTCFYQVTKTRNRGTTGHEKQEKTPFCGD